MPEPMLPANPPRGRHPSRPALLPPPGERGLVVATLCAIAASLGARHLGLAGAAAAVAIAAATTLLGRRAGPWLLAVPAALAGVRAPEPEVVWPRPGPVALDAVVEPGVRLDPRAGETRVLLTPHTQRGPRFLCVVRGALGLLPGDRVAGIARLPAQEHRRRDRLLPVVEAEAEALRVTAGGPSPWRATEAARLALQQALLDALPGESGALLCHLVLGQGPPLAEDLTAAHRATGLSHLLAVSGAHASMLALLLAAAFATLTGRSPGDSRAFRRGAALLLLGYGAITGMQPPVVRALVALGVVLWARASGRAVPVASLLALPALLTTIVAPDDLLSASFNLSYAAVLGLALAGAARPRSFWQRWVALPVLGSVGATLATMPLTLHYFGQIAPWAIAGTPLLAPLATVMLAGGILVGAVGQIAPWLAAAIALPVGAASDAYCATVRELAELPLAPVLAVAWPDPWVLAGTCGLGIALLAAKPGRLGAAGLCLCLALPYFVPAGAPEPGFALLAVGHGQAGVAHLPGGAAVAIDCGSLGDPHRAAEATARALAPRRALDLLVLTHDHSDHTAGVVTLLQRVRVQRAALPAEMLSHDVARRLQAHGVELLPLQLGARLEPLPGVLLTRPAGAELSENDRSLWVRLRWPGLEALLTGDALEAGVAAWLTSPDAGPADVLVLPHHGRRNARADDLLQAVRPRLALASNRGDGEPSAQARLAQALGVRVLETGLAGDIVVEAEPPWRVRTQWPERIER